MEGWVFLSGNAWALLTLSLFFHCQTLSCLHTACGVWCTQVQPTGALLSRQALQWDHHAVMIGCITRTANHSKLPTFYEIHRWKERGVVLLVCLNLLEQPECCSELAHGEISPLNEDEEGEQSLCEAVATFPNVLPFNTGKSQEQRASGKTNTIMQNKPGSQSEHWHPLLS